MPFLALRQALGEPFARLITSAMSGGRRTPRCGGSARCALTSPTPRRPRRSWCAWMTCNGRARPRWPRCARRSRHGRLASWRSAPGSNWPASWSSAPPRQREPKRRRTGLTGDNPVGFGQGERMTVQLSHLDKLFFPDAGITKGDLVNYYQEIAPHILGYLRIGRSSSTGIPTASPASASCRRTRASTSPTGWAGPRWENRAGRCAMWSPTEPTHWCTWRTRARSSSTSSSAG